MITYAPLLAIVFGASVTHAISPCMGIEYFGEDTQPFPVPNDAPRVTPTTNSDFARDSFIGAILSAATEDFESFAIGDPVVPPLLLDFGGALTAELTGGEIRKDPPVNGQYAISPDQYWFSDEDFTLTFSEPISAFGFYGVDIGDVEGTLTFIAIREDMTECSIEIPHEVDGFSGNVLYFGYIDLFNPFIGAKFINSEKNRDRFAFDDFTIAVRENLTLCLDGITNADGTICCDGGCGVCGGCDCDLNPGGAALCCPGEIASSGFECMLASDVACILGPYTPSEDSECLF